MKSFSIFIGALILLVNLILIFRVIYTYTKVWLDRRTSLKTKKLKSNTNYKEVANKAFENLLTNQLTVSVALKFNSPTSLLLTKKNTLSIPLIKVILVFKLVKVKLLKEVIIR